MTRLGWRGKGGLGTRCAAAGVCVMGPACCLPIPCPHSAAVWAPAMVRDSSWAGLSMCLGRLWREIKICILNSRLTAPVGKATGKQAGLAQSKLSFSWEQLKYSFE